MGIDYSGGMIIGAEGSEFWDSIEDQEDIAEWCYEQDMSGLSPYYDCHQEDCYWGFSIDDVEVSKMDEDWLQDIRAKAAKFKELTGVDAWLIGSQDIT